MLRTVYTVRIHGTQTTVTLSNSMDLQEVVDLFIATGMRTGTGTGTSTDRVHLQYATEKAKYVL